MKHRIITSITAMLIGMSMMAANKYDNPDTLIVARDGTGEFRNIADAVEVCRAFMEYHKVIFVKKGVYKEKLIVPSWLTNIEICGEDRDETIITYDDNANIPRTDVPGNQPMGTFRSYTLKIEGTDITLKNITVENSSQRPGQAVALHTEGDRIKFVNCRFLGNQDTIYTGAGNTRLHFDHCYIEGTTDFIFGPSTAWFEACDIHCKSNSYITAASTPKGVSHGYIFNHCNITLADGIDNVYLGRPWRPYAKTVFMNCHLPKGIRREGWHNWKNADNEKTAFYAEYNNSGEGADTKQRHPWIHVLSKKEAEKIISTF